MANDGVGHLTNGFAFLVLGLWHLFNHIKLHAINPKLYTSLPWFSTSRSKYLELYLIIAGSSISFTMEIFHKPALDLDGSIHSTYIPNLEHSVIALAFFIYAIFAILLDKFSPPTHYSLTFLIGAVALGVELLLFHFHSTGQMGLEGQYHWLLQVVIFTSLATTVLSINYSKSFLISFVRSLSILFQGVWFVNIGFVLWTPGLIPKGCFLDMDGAHYVARCPDKEALERAKSLANVQFSYSVIVLLILVMTIYLVMIKSYGEKVEYLSLTELYENDEENSVEVHSKVDVVARGD